MQDTDYGDYKRYELKFNPIALSFWTNTRDAKGKFVRVLHNKAPQHEGAEKDGGVAPCFLALAPDEDLWSFSWSDRLTPGESAPESNCIGGWVVPRAGLDGVVKGKTPCPC